MFHRLLRVCCHSKESDILRVSDATATIHPTQLSISSPQVVSVSVFPAQPLIFSTLLPISFSPLFL